MGFRIAHRGARLEAATSRPLLLAAVGEAASHAGLTQLYLAPVHGKLQTIKALIVNIRAALRHVEVIAEQLPRVDRWAVLARCIYQRVVPSTPAWLPLNALPATG